MGRGSFDHTSFFSWLIYWGMGEDLREKDLLTMKAVEEPQ